MLKSLGVLAICLISFSACNKRVCNDPTGPCGDTPPTGEACTAYFETWFYNSNNNTCEMIGYSGCGPKGFATEAECNNSCVSKTKK
ncbi:MAG: hypothetical protein BGO31_09040 [Bacteroidetes bacterium 43-16]|nr:MAG: hypothetical protein BGO31_09040 [Bacteroidetes bacterium 43-16]